MSHDTTTVLLLSVLFTLFAAVELHVARRADFFAVGSAVFAALAVLNFAYSKPGYASVQLGVAALYFAGWWLCRNDDNDNHRGKRWKAWAKSKLPKPVARTVRSVT